MELKGTIQNEIQNIQLCTNCSTMCNCYYCLFAYTKIKLVIMYKAK